MVFVGLVWGLAVPNTPYPRLALSAHIQYEVSGMLWILVALLILKVENTLGFKSLIIQTVVVWLTWPMLLAATANSWWGTLDMLPIAGQQAGATGGEPWQETIVFLTHVVAGLALIFSWFVLMLGFWKSPQE